MNGTQQTEALRLADKYEIEGFLQDHRFAQEHWCRQAAAELRHQHARIEELEEQLSAIGAGGVEPLRKSAAAAPLVPQGWKPVQIELLERIQESLGSFLSDQGWSQSDMDTADALGGLLAAATQPAAQWLELANCKGDKWLTVVYRDIQPGDESRTIGEHPKVSALSWSHALHDRDAALAAKAKQGERP